MKHIKYTSKTHETYDCKRLGGAELDAGVEVGDGAWSSPVQQRRDPPTILQCLLAAQARADQRGPVTATPAPLLARPQSSIAIRSQGMGHGAAGDGV